MKSRLGECLLDAGKITRFELDSALHMQKEQGQSLGETLVSLDIITEEDLVDFLSGQLNIPVADFQNLAFQDETIDAFSEGRARKHMCLPVRYVGDTVEVLMYDPLDVDALEEVAKSTGKEVKVLLAPKSVLLSTIEEQYMLQSHRFAREAQMEKRLMQQIREAAPQEQAAHCVAVLSNKGGVGKTNLAVNLACALSQEDQKTLLIDADLGTANVGAKIGYQPKITLVHLLREERPIEDIIVSTEYGFDLIAGQPGEYKLANMSVEHRLRFIEAFLHASREYDVAIFDLSAGIESTVLDFALSAHEALIVTTPQDIVAGYSCIKALFYRFMEKEQQLTNTVDGYIPRREFSPGIVINQVDSPDMAEQVFAKVQATAKKYLRVRGDTFRIEPHYTGYILYDQKGIRATEMQHRPYLSAYPDTDTAACYRHLAGELLKPDTLRSTDVQLQMSWFSRFTGLLGSR